MQTTSAQLVELENRFWQALVDEEVDIALSMLDEPSLLVGARGGMQVDHASYRKMAEQGSAVVKSFEISEMNVVLPKDDTAVLTYRVRQSLGQRGKPGEVEQDMADASVWVQKQGRWLCVMHTETPVDRSGKENRQAR